ncbi:PREDICTED: uncharacterized protein LOC104598137 [Nelumbo nucifera]|uniref:Uncharacterized protein LOC104598137 n=2 Tax=Nelumbo nucifera TaxID=4432 RepID=A0A1U7ZVB4_NELNU|nr:PREDICTED: uncharacterized protein LOC104598137 [Nelumbo nucifera]DAD31249.1 TPA_asm: hypothetical protein HUJ06_010100 [Nelumbo nucifera]
MFISGTHFDLVNKRSVNEFLFTKIFLFVSSFWFSATGYMFYLIGLLGIYVFRLKRGNSSGGDHTNSNAVDDANGDTVTPEVDYPSASGCFKPESAPEITNFENSDHDQSAKKEESRFCFKFQFQTYEETRGESGDSISPKEAPMVSTSKYQVSSRKDLYGFVEEPEVVSFTIKELYADSNYGSFSNREIIHGGFLSEKDFQQLNSNTEAVREPSVENYSPVDPSKEEKPGKTEPRSFTNDPLTEKDGGSSEINFPRKDDVSRELQFLSEKDFKASNLESESASLSDVFSPKNHTIDSNSGDFLFERDFGGGSDTVNELYFDGEKVELREETQNCEAAHPQNTNYLLDNETIEISEGPSSVWEPIKHRVHSMDDDIELMEDDQTSEESNLPSPSTSADTEVLSDNDFEEEEEEDNPGPDVLGNFKEREAVDGLEIYGQPNIQNSSVSETDDADELEILWEHEELIEQLRMELRKVKGGGLPTILEEDESPKIMDDLKPWKIDEKFQHEDRMEELQRFYKSYSERMRKLDILNYQKMYAIGFLQLKDSHQSISNRKSTTPAIMSLLCHNFRLFKRGRVEADPAMKFAGELQCDLEMVYVGQTCLSWELLYWQYKKAQELQETDQDGIRRYNHVGGEFQQFQVIIQRFLENEPFEGPRVQNYVKNRCVLRNLLQVPVIKEDVKNKMKGKGRRGEDDVITISMLTKTIQKSMQILWEFIRADKGEANVILKGLLGTQAGLQNSADSALLMDVQTNLQKKEKKLKDLLRTGNCIVKRLQKHHQESRFDEVMFCSQVDLKLVSRVLNMSRITSEQLEWCHKKLNKINFVHRKIRREPSILLFPC